MKLQDAAEDEIRFKLENRLTRYRASLRIGAVELLDGKRFLADVLDNNNTVVLSVEVDRHNGEILRCF